MIRRIPDPGAVPDPPWHPDDMPLGGHAAITIWRNPLDPSDRISVAVPPGFTLIGWLQRHYPNGFGRPIRILWNGNPVEVEHSDRLIAVGDVIGIYVAPGLPASVGAAIVASLIASAISIVASVAISILFKPKKPGVTPKPDPVYDIASAANAPRIADPVPVIYGQVITVPDWASQPYTFFDGNNQFLDQILVIGQGDHRIDAILVGDTPVTALLDPGAVQYWIYPASAHNQTMGTIFDQTGVMENVVTSAEVADQEFSGVNSTNNSVTLQTVSSTTAPSTVTIINQYFQPPKPPSLPPGPFTLADYDHLNPNDGQTFSVKAYDPVTGIITTNESDVLTYGQKPEIYLFFQGTQSGVAAGPFVIGKPGVRGDRIMLDLVWSQGLYYISSGGTLQPHTVQISIAVQPIDDNGINTGAAIIHNESITRATNTPVRLTFAYDVAPGRYSVKLTRDTPPPPDTQTVDSFTWVSLKTRLVDVTTPVYGAVTLLVIRIRATNGIAANASSRVRVQCTRLLPPLGAGPARPTRDPADAFADIYANLIYGARRPVAELDLATLAALQAHWAGRAMFDAVFNTKATVWDALGYALQTAGAAPIPDGQKMSAMQDGVKALRTQFYSDANMIKGSLQIGYQWDKPGDYDGFQVEYRDPVTFAAAYAVYPPGAVDVEQVTLFGCTDLVTAGQYARLLWQRKLLQRKTAQFTTELEGLLPRYADRIAVAATLPRWGQTGLITAFDGLTILTDQPLDWAGANHVVMLRAATGEPSGLIPVTRGDADDQVILSQSPGFGLSPGWTQEATAYAFGTSQQVVRDFTVTDLAHQGGVTTQITGMIYAPAIFDQTLPWMVEPI
jgi:hypothetical protein